MDPRIIQPVATYYQGWIVGELQWFTAVKLIGKLFMGSYHNTDADIYIHTLYLKIRA